MCLLPCRPEECEGQAHVSYLCIRDLPVILGGLFRLSCPIPVPSLRHFERSREISRSLGAHRELPATAGGCAEARPFPEGILRQAQDDNGTTLSGETGNGPFGPDAPLSIAKNPRAQHSESARVLRAHALIHLRVPVVASGDVLSSFPYACLVDILCPCRLHNPIDRRNCSIALHSARHRAALDAGSGSYGDALECSRVIA